MAFKHVSNWHKSEDNPGSVVLSTQDVDGPYTCLSKTLTLLGSVNAQYKVHRRKQVLDKLNPQMSSLASEPFPEAGKNVFGPSFEKKVKKRNETVKILSKAAPKKSNLQFFRRGSSSQFRSGRGGKFPGNGPITYQASQPEGEAHISELCSTPKFPVAVASQANVGMLPLKENLNLPLVKSVLSSSGLSSIEASQLPIAGRLQHFTENWQAVRNDPWVFTDIFKVPYSLYNHTTPRFSSLSQSIGGGRKIDRQRTRRAYSKTGNTSGFRTRIQHGICQQPVFNPPKGRRTKTSLQPPPIKSIYPKRTFQNGGYTKTY